MDGVPMVRLTCMCAERNGNFDIYIRSRRKGVRRKRLTDAEGLDDGLDILRRMVNLSIAPRIVRCGHMQIWRMERRWIKTAANNLFDENSNWFAHPSPDNNWAVYIAYYLTRNKVTRSVRTLNFAFRWIPKTKTIKDITPRLLRRTKARSMCLRGVLTAEKLLL